MNNSQNFLIQTLFINQLNLKKNTHLLCKIAFELKYGPNVIYFLKLKNY